MSAPRFRVLSLTDTEDARDWAVRDSETAEDTYSGLTMPAALDVAKLLNRAEKLAREDTAAPDWEPPEAASGCCDTWEEHRGER